MSNDNNNPAIAAFDQQLAASTTRFEDAPHDPEREAESLRLANPAEMVQQVTKRIDYLRASLEKSDGFDPATGKPRYAIAEGERRRQTMELELRNLRTSVLPYTQARAAEIEAKKAALPTQEQLLISQAERQRRMAEAAKKRAEEIEVEEMARRMLAGRRSSGFGG
jgi:hypothetical protein